MLAELYKILVHWRGHVAEQVNSGPLVDIDRHLAALEAAAAGLVPLEEALHGVLGELYGLHQAAAAAPVADEQPVEHVPATVPVLVGESGPELTLPADEPQDPTAA